MFIHLTPQYRTDTLQVETQGEVLIVNGTAFDLSATTENAPMVVDCPWIVGPATRANGRLVVTLILPHGDDAPEETLFPAPIEVDRDGPVPLPPPCVLQEVEDEVD